MKNLALSTIQKMKAYNPPLSGRWNYTGLLLDFNERTQSLTNDVVGILQKLLKGKLQQYPEYFKLEEQIAKYVDVSLNQIMVTNGSDQGIDIIFRTFTRQKDKVIIPSPSFAMFYQCAKIIGNKIIQPLYRKENKLAFPLKDVLSLIGKYKQIKLIVICNPNNPTGSVVSLADIEKIAKKACNTIIYIDEAYGEYSGVSAIPLIKKYQNIIVSRTFSKAFGLAALRVGYVIASEVYIKEMLKVRGAYDVNMAGYFAASKAMTKIQQVQKYVNEVMQKAKPKLEKFFTKNNITFYPSKSNFILFECKDSVFVQKELERNGIRVRPQNHEAIKGTLRVSIGTVKQMQRFIKTFSKIVRQKYEKSYSNCQ